MVWWPCDCQVIDAGSVGPEVGAPANLSSLSVTVLFVACSVKVTWASAEAL